MALSSAFGVRKFTDMKLALYLGLGYFLGDSTPGGSNNVILMENSGGILMETGNFILLEA